jgi:hypothetical protein
MSARQARERGHVEFRVGVTAPRLPIDLHAVAIDVAE